MTRDDFKVMELDENRLLSKNSLSQRYELLFIHIPKPVKKPVNIFQRLQLKKDFWCYLVITILNTKVKTKKNQYLRNALKALDMST